MRKCRLEGCMMAKAPVTGSITTVTVVESVTWILSVQFEGSECDARCLTVSLLVEYIRASRSFRFVSLKI